MQASRSTGFKASRSHRFINNADSDSHFAATVGLGVTEIEAADAEEAVAAIRAGQMRVVGKRMPPRFFIGNTVQSIYTIVRKGVRRGRKV
ncbi:MAG: hypothetical protein NTY37_11645 [Methanothrix sp.]|nr:hypothetical protein [Methanothrix sp.]